MVGFSFLQPWLHFILNHQKGFECGGAWYAVENRTWRLPRKMVGQTIALHASAGYDHAGWQFVLERPYLKHCQEGAHKTVVPRSAILGTARLVGAFELDLGTNEMFGDLAGPHGYDDLWVLARRSPWCFGPWCWILGDVRKLEVPIPCRGHLSFWPLPPEVEAALARAA